MNQSATIQRLTNHLKQIESEIVAIRQELGAFPEQQTHVALPDVTMPSIWVNKTTLQKQMEQLFLTLSIQGESIGAEKLQQQMREAKLTANELSQTIISTREE